MNVIFENNLIPFKPQPLNACTFQGIDVAKVGEASWMIYDFGMDSAQANFFRTSHKGTQFITIVYDGNLEPPKHIEDPRIVASCFGLMRDNSIELWYLSAHKTHPLNQNAGGQKWGFYGIQQKIGKKVTWLENSFLKGLTMKHHDYISGSPNPYVAWALTATVERLQCDYIHQHASLPCSKLFSKQYTQISHPGTYLIYKSLGFVQSVDGVFAHTSPSKIAKLYLNVLQKMEIGDSAVIGTVL